MGSKVITAAEELQARRAAERVRLIEPLAKSWETTRRLRELLASASALRSGAPESLGGDIDAVIEATKKALEVSTHATSADWDAAKSGGWSAKELRQVGLAPVRGPSKAGGTVDAQVGDPASAVHLD
ncbi:MULTISPECIES: hypothetical protein [unclassified Amycolatopsis]|uniref:hypothetical protein n=1 Tax=unclassified Amycolatopsis TaxID=2618356 RepID=UPI002875666F|nr:MULTISPECIES: hypothetical protein [unclassified Amycolatopsis]MDS0140625.1 hypothetical protein [Amycolatopsis sp. 505]MDS0149275.1 hypothetical protein [Amycolatopsis sp. CM201R]